MLSRKNKKWKTKILEVMGKYSTLSYLLVSAFILNFFLVFLS